MAKNVAVNRVSGPDGDSAHPEDVGIGTSVEVAVHLRKHTG